MRFVHAHLRKLCLSVLFSISSFSSSTALAQSACELYPIALSSATIDNTSPGDVVDVLNGSSLGNFGWLTWAGSPSVPTLVASLTQPGDSDTYVNPDDANDATISVGDYVEGKPGVSNAKKVRKALDDLIGEEIIVPVWDEIRGQGADTDYRVVSFARIKITDYHLPGQNRISAEFLGLATCGDVNAAPIVDAGGDLSIVLGEVANLNGSVIDDGLPSGGTLLSQWTVVSLPAGAGGPGNVTFGDSNAPVTTATFTNVGAYVLSLTGDDGALSASDDVTVTVNDPNSPPVADDQSLNTDEDVSLAITLTGSDPNSDPITFAIETFPNHGSLSGAPPSVVYYPFQDFNGTDSFTFVVSDGVFTSAVATVDIFVNPINDAPVADDVAVTNDEDVAFSIVLSGADVDADTFSFSIVDAPTNGALSGTAPTNLTYTPNANFNGIDSFTYETTDGSLTSTLATVLITLLPINDQPIANAQSVNTDEDSALNITLTGFDVDDDPLLFTVTAVPTNGVLTGTAPNLTYAPNPNFNGVDSFEFVASDGPLDSDPKIITITVNPINDAPLADAQSVSTDEDVALAITLTGSDIDSVGPGFTVVAGPTNGSLSGSAPNLVYTPSLNFSGEDSFTFEVDDGSLTSSVAVVSITVGPINDTPLADAQSVSTDEDVALAITLTGSDVDDPILAFAVVDGPTNGVLTGTAPNLTYTPNADFDGADSFTFEVSDASATSAPSVVSISVLPINDAPIADAQSVSTDEDVALNVTVTGSDIDSTNLTFAVIDTPTNGVLTGTAPNLIYTPSLNFNGSDSFTFSVFDGSVSSVLSVVQISVLPINDTPIADAQSVSTDEDVALNITLTGSDIDSVGLMFAVVDGPTNGVLSGTAPNLTYTPNGDFNGNDSLTFEVDDGSLTSSVAVVSISVNPINDAPLADAQSVNTDEDVALNITLTGSDTDDTNLTFAVTDGPTNGVLSGTAPNLTYTPNGDFDGDDSFSFEVSDGVSTSAVAVVAITVNPINDTPLAHAQSVSTDEDVALNITLTGSDIDSVGLTFAVVDGPTNGALTGTAPNLTYTPNGNFDGNDSFTFEVDDGSLTSSVAVVSISVNPINDAPVADAQALSTDEDVALNITLTGSDIDSVGLTFAVVDGPTNGVLTGTAPNLTYSPGADFNGSDSFTFEVSDASVTSAPSVVSISVLPINDAPLADAQSVSTDEDVALNITLTGTDVDDLLLAFAVVDAPTNGVLSGTAPNLTYTPNGDFNGDDSFSFEVADASLTSAPAVVSISVLPVNDAPLADAQSVSTDEDTALLVTLSGTDIDSTNLTFAVVDAPTNGVLTGLSPNLTYTPTLNFNGVDSFTFEVSDGIATSLPAVIVITVNPVNDPPVADAQLVVTDEDEATNIVLTATDVDDAVLTFAIVGGPTNGLLFGSEPSVLYSPNADFFGNDSFTFTASDSSATSLPSVVNVSVLSVNDGPIVDAGPDQIIDFPLTNETPVMGSAVDIDTAVLTGNWAQFSGPGSVTFVDSNAFNTVASFSAPGVYVLRFTASDGALDAFDDVEIEVNDTPVVDAGTDLVITTNDQAVLGGSAVDDGLPSGAPLSVFWSQRSGPGVTIITNGGQAIANARFTSTGIYTLQLAAADTRLVDFDEVVVTVTPSGTNNPPFVDAGIDQTVGLTSNATLAGSITDDGLPFGSNVLSQWSVVSGPGTVVFADSNSIATVATFSDQGAYTLQLTGNDGELTASDTVTISISFGNQPPVVSAGADQTNIIAVVNLIGGATDDGLPSGSLTLQWSVVSGPGSVAFDNATNGVTTATLGVAGSYVLELAATDGLLSETDTVSITYFPNLAPVVDAGPDAAAPFVGCKITLAGSVTDDGLPAPANITHSWEMISGPGNAFFDDASQLDTLVSFSAVGLYVLKLTASDGYESDSDVVQVRVDELCSTVAPTGTVAWWTGNGHALDIVGVHDGSTLGGISYAVENVSQAFSFDGLDDSIFVSATTNLAGISDQLTVEGWIRVDSISTQKVFAFHDGADIGMYLEVIPDGESGILVRGNSQIAASPSGTDVFVSTPVGLVKTGEYVHVAFTHDRAPSTVKLYINGNVAAQTVQPNFYFIAETSYDLYIGSSAGTAEFFDGSIDELTFYNRELSSFEIQQIALAGNVGKCPFNGNTPPIVDAGTDIVALDVLSPFQLKGRVEDDGLPTGAGVNVQWEQLTGPGTATFADPVAPITSVTLDQPGIYTLSLRADDGALSGADGLVIRAGQTCGTTPSDLVSYWPAEGSADDALGGNDGNLVGPINFVSGLAGAAFDFGSGAKVFVPASTELHLGTNDSSSYEVWFKLDALTSDQPIFEYHDGINRGIFLRVLASGQLQATYSVPNGGGSTVFSIFSGGGLISTGVFHHVVMTHNKANTQGRLYHNGVQLGTANHSLLGNSLRTEYDLFLGHSPELNRSVKGVLDEVAFYKRDLSSTEIQNLFASGAAGKCINPANEPPSVYAGVDQDDADTNVVVSLQGFAQDDGQPAGTVAAAWSVIGGPGTVTLGSPLSLSSTATFDAPGVYVLELSANDGEQSANDAMEVRVGGVCATGSTSLAAWWPANGDATDRQGDNDGVYIGDVTFSDGVVGSAFDLAGGTHVAVDASPSLHVSASTNGSSYEAWFKLDTLTVDEHIFEYNDGASRGLYLSVQPNGTIRVSFITAAGVNFIVTSAAGLVTTGSFHHVVLTHDRTSNQVRIYHNGALVASRTETQFAGPLRTAYDLFLGYSPPFNRGIDGLIDEVAFYTAVLSVGEVAALASAPPSGICPLTPANQAPIVHAGLSQSETLGTPVTLQGFVTDDGLPTGSVISVAWSLLTGPGTATFTNTQTLNMEASFSTAGDYVLQLAADDGELTNSATVAIAITPVVANQAPDVYAGTDILTASGTPTTIYGSVTDDGLPNGTLEGIWSVDSGPGTVTFGCSTCAVTTATFSDLGNYVLRITYHDSELTNSDSVLVFVKPAIVNQPPLVDAGPDTEIPLLQPTTNEIIVLTPPPVLPDQWISDVADPGAEPVHGPGFGGAAYHGLAVNEDGDVFLTGSFDDLNGVEVQGLGAWDGCMWGPLPYNVTGFVNVGGTMGAVAARDEEAFVTGFLQDLDNNANADFVARWDGTNWVHWEPTLSFNFIGINDIEATSNAVYIGGGDFSFFPDVTNGLSHGEGHKIAKWDGTNWLSLQSGIIDTNVHPLGLKVGVVNAIKAMPNGDVYAGGQFTMIASNGLAENIILWNGSNWLSLAGGLVQTGGGGAVVRDIVSAPNGDIYVSGQFDNAGGVSVDNLARWDGANWHGFPSGSGLNTFFPLQELAYRAETDELFVSGRNGLTRWDGANWNYFGTNGPVGHDFTLVAAPEGVFVGGDFQVVNGRTALDIAKWGQPTRVDVHCPESIAVFGAPVAGTSVVLTAEVIHPCGEGNFDVSFNVNGGAIEYQTTVAGIPDGSVFVSFTNNYVPGDHVVTVTAVDDSGVPDICVVPVFVNSPAMALLDGSVIDDGLPTNGSLTIQWQQISGPPSHIISPQSAISPVAFDTNGTYVFQLVGDDSIFAATDQVVFTINPIGDTNQPPTVFAGNDTTTGISGSLLLTGVASDDGRPFGQLDLNWAQISGPGNSTVINPQSAVSTVSFSTPGAYLFRLTADDGELSAFDEVAVTVDAVANLAPVADAGPNKSGFVFTDIALEGSSTDDGRPFGIVSESWQLVSGPGAALFSHVNDINFATFNNAGDYVLQFVANDGLNTGTDTMTVTVFAVSSEPFAEIISPSNTQVVTAPTPVIGTVQSDILDFYELQIRLQDSGQDTNEGWIVIGTGTSPVSSNTLGQLDPTLSLNGLYDIRLRVVDLAGREVFTEPESTVIDGNMKVGNFTITFQDLNIPLEGIPIQVLRTYDSRDKRLGDFGYGWTLSIADIRVQKSRALDLKWEQEITGFGVGGLPIYEMRPRGERVVTVTFPDNEVQRFRVGVNPSFQLGVPIFTPDVIFEPTEDTRGTLEVVDDKALKVIGDIAIHDPFGSGSVFFGLVDIIEADTYEPFNPTRFKYTSEEGIEFILDEEDGLIRVTDRNGNSVTYADNGIFHDNGKSISFHRDPQGVITNIVDPNGRVMVYECSTNGDLAVFSDREGNNTSFTYTNNHVVLDIFDARGVRAVRNEYDADNRLIRQTDAEGNDVEFTHNIVARVETIEDRLGNITTHEYDEFGNVTRTIDALTNITTFTYDDFDNETSQTDALGNTTSNVYDSTDNLIATVDPLGNTTLFSYDANRNLLSITDPNGNTTSNEYDGAGNLIREIDPLGNETVHEYDSKGNLVKTTDALGNVTSNQYDLTGNLVAASLRDASGALLRETTFTYDPNGNQLTETTSRTTPSGTEILVTSNVYDSLDRVVETVLADGTSTRTIYNEIGQVATNIDQLGRSTSFEYDSQGNQTRITHPDGTTQETTYDEENRVTSTIDQLGRVTTNLYDALGRQIATIAPDGARQDTFYDAIGRVIEQMDALGNSTYFAYEENCACVGRQTTVTNALGEVFSRKYDANGNLVSTLDSLGRVVSNVYDELNRRVETIMPDGSSEQFSFDALGRLVAKTDQATNTTTFGYDGLGRLVAVTNALNDVTRYEYDEVGNQVAQIDANNHETQYEYDNLGRRTKRTLPEGEIETMYYDAVGNVTNKIDFNGQSITYTYDIMNRLVSKVPVAGVGDPGIFWSYNAVGLRTNMTDASGVTLYAYDSRDRLAAKASPQGTLVYSYDENGNVLTIDSLNTNGAGVTYTYDVLNRLKTVDDGVAGVTTYDYDEVGNLDSFMYPNGIEHAYEYDALNRLTNMAVGTLSTQVAGYRYQLGPAGNRQSVTELSGRTANYAYDNLYRLTQETVSGAIVAGSISYTYDAVGNRQTRSSTLGNIINKVYGYDDNDLLNSDTYDDNGNTVAASLRDASGTETPRSFSYDFENRIHAMTNGAEVIRITYDGDGNRARKVIEINGTNAAVIHFLVDTVNPSGFAQVMEELTDVGSGPQVTRAYTYGIDLISQDQLVGTNWVASFYGYDGHGSVRHLTDDLGNVTDTYDYDAFGTLIDSSGSTLNNYLYTGEQFDHDLGLYFLRARYMDTDRGRFWSMDPFEGFDQDPITIHKYLYASANPIMIVDPSGLVGEFTLPGISSISGFLGVMGKVLGQTVVLVATCAVSAATEVGVCSERDRGIFRMRVQLQDNIIVKNTVSPGILVDHKPITVRRLQAYINNELAALVWAGFGRPWFSLSKHGANFIGAVAEVSKKLNKWPGLGGKRSPELNFEQAMIPKSPPFLFRVDVDNLNGWNLRTFH